MSNKWIVKIEEYICNWSRNKREKAAHIKLKTNSISHSYVNFNVVVNSETLDSQISTKKNKAWRTFFIVQKFIILDDK